MTDIKPCPFCGCSAVKLELEHDCYSSWGKATCNGCSAYATCGTDKEGVSYPDPVDNWEEIVMKEWDEGKVYKGVIEEKVR